MKIDLNDEYCIDSDELNFIIQRKSVIGKAKPVLKKASPQNIGKIRYKDLSYHRNMDSLIHNLLELKVRLSNEDSFLSLKDELTKFKNEIIITLNKNGISSYLPKDRHLKNENLM